MKLLGNLMLALCLATAGLAQDVHYNFARDVDFSQFKTYKWVEVGGGERLDDITANQVRSAIEEELAKKGLQRVDSDDANLFIGYQAAVRQEKEISSYNSGWGYGPGWGMGPGISTVETSTMLIGSLVLDMYEAPKRQLVWRSVATKTLDPNAKPDKREKNIRKAAEKLLKDYPPKAKS